MSGLRSTLVAFALVVASCAIMGEKMIRLRAEIVPPSGSSDKEIQCILTLSEAKNGARVDWRKVGRRVEEDILVSPLSKEYFATVNCEGIGQSKTNVFQIGEEVGFGEIVDLGQILIVRQNISSEN